MAEVSKEQIEAKLKEYIDPYVEKDLVSAKLVKDISIDGGKVTLAITLGFPAKGYVDTLSSKLTELLGSVDGVSEVVVNITTKIAAHKAQKGVEPIEGIKNIIAIASGKGGVGKSTTSVNLALALAAEGASVGILDADIYGPSQPRMLGVTGRPESEDGKTLQPITSYDIQAMSIGFLVDEETPMIWRGPMVTQALNQLLNDTKWTELDYLIIDLPPGTGDIQLTLAQRVPVSGAVIVTTPQDIALLDARKAMDMFKKTGTPVLGVIENMSTHICSECGHEEHIFGHGGAKAEADKQGFPFLGEVPLHIDIRTASDGGAPIVVSDPESKPATAFRDIARKLIADGIV